MMELKEFALILFTVLSQAAIGAFILLAWLRLQSKDAALDGVYRKSTVVVLGVSAVGLLASVFHLGRPLLAMTAMKHLATSWLSREIFFSGGFFVLLLAVVLLEKQAAVRKVLSGLAALSGVLAVVSMSASYDATIYPAWQGWGTYAAFIGTAVLVGLGLVAGLIAGFGRKVETKGAALQRLVGATVVALGVGLVAYPLYLATLGAGGMEAQATLKLLGGEFAWVLALRWALTLVGGLVPLVLTWRRMASGKATSGLVFTAACCLLAGELAGRYLFYVTGVPISIG
ncbi:MAG: dmsC2 [Symbiobacteriaceae bacterium]|jgi:anaerobic dimethyl sulfoxide reductase subunit C (anchor subunit)|nr:dmsC2 [Symbiobacteriaceae bacterium]